MKNCLCIGSQFAVVSILYTAIISQIAKKNKYFLTFAKKIDIMLLQEAIFSYFYFLLKNPDEPIWVFSFITQNNPFGFVWVRLGSFGFVWVRLGYCYIYARVRVRMRPRA